MNVGLLVLLTLSQLPLPAGPSKPTGVVRIERCLVSVIDDIQVPSQESGILRSLEVKEGMLVTKDQLLGQVNDRLMQLQRDVAVAELEVAKIKSENNVNVRYAEATFRVAEADYNRSKEATDKVRGTFTAIELAKKQLEAKQAELQIEKASHDLQVSVKEKDGAAAKVSLAEEQIDRRKIRSPIEGEVVEILSRPGEWIEPGHAVFRVVGLKKLRVAAILDYVQHNPVEIANRTVTVRCKMPGGREENFAGKITFVSPLIQAGGQYRVWCEVENRVENGQFLLRPGVEVVMDIQPAPLAQQPVTRQ